MKTRNGEEIAERRTKYELLKKTNPLYILFMNA
jgi:hypothetical protein